jgi:hypothetical protein
MRFQAIILLSRLLATPAHAAFFDPDALTSSLEHILVDTHGAYSSGVQTLGRETAAQWLRVAFHDFVTANVSAGTGGIDASIGFETLRRKILGVLLVTRLLFLDHMLMRRCQVSETLHQLKGLC